jgi:hypothetical protein
MKPTITECRGTMSGRGRSLALVRAGIVGAVLLSGAHVALAQVYGVARSTTVVRGPNGNVAAASKTTVVAGGGSASKSTVVVAGGGSASHSTVVVAGGGTLPHGYIAVLPAVIAQLLFRACGTTPWAAFTTARKCIRATPCM